MRNNKKHPQAKLRVPVNGEGLSLTWHQPHNIRSEWSIPSRSTCHPELPMPDFSSLIHTS